MVVSKQTVEKFRRVQKNLAECRRLFQDYQKDTLAVLRSAAGLEAMVRSACPDMAIECADRLHEIMRDVSIYVSRLDRLNGKIDEVLQMVIDTHGYVKRSKSGAETDNKVMDCVVALTNWAALRKDFHVSLTEAEGRWTDHEQAILRKLADDTNVDDA